MAAEEASQEPAMCGDPARCPAASSRSPADRIGALPNCASSPGRRNCTQAQTVCRLASPRAMA
jgi:hypothetical protein